MNVTEILAEIDRLLKESRLAEAEEHMINTLKRAQEECRSDIELTLYNELAGFYRDCGRFSESLDCCRRSEELLNALGITDCPQHTAALLNCANACRAAGLFEESAGYYQRIKQALALGFGNDELTAGYYNNMSLLQQELGEWENAAKSLENALSLTADDECRNAITRTNLAVCLAKTGEYEKAERTLLPAVKYFFGQSPSDFHYSAALAASGDICFGKGEYDKAAQMYEAALSEIELHMGKNNFYEIVSENLAESYKQAGGRKRLTGLQLCERYFEAFGRPMLKRSFAEHLDKLACGLAGEGSECMGFDDELSADHDFGPAFCIWAADDLPEETVKELQKAYELLPKEYMGLKRRETINGGGRTGVIRISDFLVKFTGLDHIPKGDEWLSVPDDMLCQAVNGRVFMDDSGVFSDIRRRLGISQPERVRLLKLSVELEKMAQGGQYNYPRAKKRADAAAAYFALSQFMESALKAAHIIEGKYAPYSKWLAKSAETLPHFKGLAAEIAAIAANDDVLTRIDRVCGIVRRELVRTSLAEAHDPYLALAAGEVRLLAEAVGVADEIVQTEWSLFDKVKNEGGRAFCQDDAHTFFIMRKSQYYTWPAELLHSFSEDLAAAIADGRNPVAEKYAYMMESTAREEFEKIKAMLPEVTAEKRALCNAICEIQTAWMDDFAEKYPSLAARARNIRTGEDTRADTSYETYLRGELFTYSDITLQLYGRFILSLDSQGKNLAEEIMKRSVLMYGFDSLDEAQKRFMRHDV